MADAAKKEKLAAAKKRLKQFQKKGSKPVGQSPTGTNNNGKSPPQTNGREPSTTKPNGNVTSKVIENCAETSNGIDTLPSSKFSITNDIPDSAAPVYQNRVTESTEKLHQLSMQINGLIAESSSQLSSDGLKADEKSQNDLEYLKARNQELALLLEKHSTANEQLNKQMNLMKQDTAKLQSSLDLERKGHQEKLKRELGALKEQLQVHIQTIGILVAEKTELSSSLNQSKKLVESKVAEVDELSGRLKASRTRVSELEKSYTSASSSSQKNENSIKEYTKEVDRLKMELYKINKAMEDFQQQNSELQAKLQTKVTECAKLEDSLLETTGKLEMSELYVQQMQNSTQNSSDLGQIDQLVTENSELKTKIDQYEDAFQKVSNERDQLTSQYQQYIEQLGQQSQALQTQILELNSERESLISKNRELEISFTEALSKKESFEGETSYLVQEKESLSKDLEKLKTDFDSINKKYQSQMTDNAQLSRLVEEREVKLEELEIQVQRLKDESVDHTSLLDSMQSDKTALSRSMAQNKELKTQLAELQNGFVKMSNENMEMMTGLQTEQHLAKELAARLGQQEEELKEMRDHLNKKEIELRELSAANHDHVDKQLYTNEQIEDRLRHYEAQSRLVDTLQKELSSAQDTINTLTNQNSILENRMHSEGSPRPSSPMEDSTKVDSLSASIQQLEAERNHIQDQLEIETNKKVDAEQALHKLESELANQVPATLNGDVISKPQFSALQHAMKQLEERYTKAMRDKADLSDQIEQMEHIILQLQGETDTIAEYVTLYQHQRNIMRERQTQKDDYISHLAKDREELQEKLGQLQQLMMQLLGERQMLHDYHDNSNVMSTNMTGSEANHFQLTGKSATRHHPHSLEEGKSPNSNFGKLNNSDLQDWPDYTSSGSDSEGSEVEAIVGGNVKKGGLGEDSSLQFSTPANGLNHSSHKTTPPTEWHTPPSLASNDTTAQKIMYLLNELGHSNMVDYVEHPQHFLHCINCTGKLIVL